MRASATRIGWKKTTLGEYVDFFNGKAIDKDDSGSFPIYGSNGIIGSTDEPKYEDAIIVGRVGAYCGSVQYERGGFWASDNTIVVRPKIKGVEEFTYYLLKKINLNQYAGGAAQPLVTQRGLRDVEIAVPEKVENQIRIGLFLAAFDNLIENNTKRIKILEEITKAIYKEWFVFFRFPEHEKVKMVDSGTEFGEIPEGWDVKQIKAFGNVITGKTPSKSNPDYYGSDVQFVKTPDMHSQHFILETGEYLSQLGAASQENKTIPPNSICVSCIGTIGVTAITAKECQTNQQINSVIPENSEHCEYLYFTILGLEQMLKNLGANGATMGNVNKGKFESIEIISPTFSLVEKFHETVFPFFSLISNLESRNNKLRRVRDLLLPKLVSGQIQVS